MRELFIKYISYPQKHGSMKACHIIIHVDFDFEIEERSCKWNPDEKKSPENS